ncbi:MAG: phosphodiesterase [Cyanobacteria bacterium J06635_15]
MIIAQISDLHVKRLGEKAYGVVDTNGFVERAIAHLNQHPPRPDVVIATGDLVDDGSVEEYAQLKKLLSPLEMPVYLAMGNHDERSALRQSFPEHTYLAKDGFVHYVIDDYPVRLIVLDTVVPNEGYGLLDAPRLAWLDQHLAQDLTKPTIVFMHHPPFRTKIDFMDGLMCQGGDALAGVIAQYPNIERIACGHLHRVIQTRWAGTVAAIAPSVAHQVTLTLQKSEPIGFTYEPPGFYLHVWSDTTGLVTHTVPIGDFEAYSYASKERIR